MKEHRITFPELALFGGTRALIGFVLGLLLAGRISREPRKIVALSTLGAGLLSTIPIGLVLFRRRRIANGHTKED
jgi:hypothetical protein